MTSENARAAEMDGTDDPVDDTVTERQRQILGRIEAQGFATIDHLADQFSVSAQTIRRDIIQLDRLKLLQRFHGGAGKLDPQVRLGYQRKAGLAVAEKQAIGRAAAAAIADGALVFLDVGTTVEAAARELARRPGFTIVTNSLRAAALFDPDDHEVRVTGGLVRGADGSMVGDAAVGMVRMHRFDHALIGCSAIEPDGAVMDFDAEKVAVKLAAMASARARSLLATSRKFGLTARIRIGALADFDRVVGEVR